jgi:hypothetical protein
MLNMAQRAFSSVILDTSSDDPPQKTTSKSKSVVSKKDNYLPVAIETTADGQAAVCTVFIRLPNQRRQPVCLGSSLIIHPKNLFLNKEHRISQQNV